jgi:putative ABC transport system ATP-binding protein
MVTLQNIQYRHTKNSGLFNYPAMQATVQQPLLITGKSGSGKTTLLHILTGLLTNYTGSVSINKVDLQTLNTKQLDAFRGKNIGIVFQQHYFIQSLTVADNIAIAAYKKTIDKQFFLQLASTLGIEPLLKKYTHKISIGEQQRVAIAKALINKPSVIVADEPTSSLDDANAAAAIQLLLQQAKANNACLIVVTHDERIKPHFTNIVSLV